MSSDSTNDTSGPRVGAVLAPEGMGATSPMPLWSWESVPDQAAQTVVVQLHQDLDMASEVAARAELSRLIAELLRPGGCLRVDLNDQFVDVRGLAVLLEGSRRARSVGAHLVLAAVPHGLRSMWRTLPGVAERLPIDGTVGPSIPHEHQSFRTSR